MFRRVGVPILSLLIGVNLFVYSLREDFSIPESVFWIPTALLLMLVLIHFGFKLASKKSKVKAFYQNLNVNDILRMVLSLAMANLVYDDSSHSMALVLFIINAVVAIFSFYVICSSWLRDKKVTPVTIFGFLWLYLLWGWLISLYISQYGTREFGHWLEKPRYTKSVPATVWMCPLSTTLSIHKGCSNISVPVQAYISVEYTDISVYKYEVLLTGEEYLVYIEVDDGYGFFKDDSGVTGVLELDDYK